LRYSKRFYSIGSIFEKTFPGLRLDLFQADMEIHPRDYSSLAFFSSWLYFIIFTPLTFLLGLIVGAGTGLMIPVLTGVTVSVFVFLYLLYYPKYRGAQRMKEIERNLIAALQHMLIEAKAGVPLFNTMLGISEGYGEVSEEFRRVVTQINAGISETEALDDASRRNPCLPFRRALWQIVNALKAGSEVSTALEAVVNTLVQEQMTNIKKYGQELNPYTMMYMLIGIIMPSMGITFLIILSSFSGISMPSAIFPIIIFGMILFQIFFIGLVKTKRPVLDV